MELSVLNKKFNSTIQADNKSQFSNNLNAYSRGVKSNSEPLEAKVSSCEQFIEKLFKIVGESSYAHQKCSSLDEINCSDPTSPDKQSHRKNAKKSIEEGRQSPIIMETERDKKYTSHHLTSLNNFLLLPSSKQTRSKHLQTGSLTLMKNAILVNMHEIEKLQESNATIKNQYQIKFSKSNEAIEILTKVVGLMQEKIEHALRICGSFNSSTARSSSKNRSLSKSRKNKEPVPHYISV